jgi:hypothetical protein
MAVTDYGRLTSITRGLVLPRIIDQIGDDHPLFDKLINKAKLETKGTQIEQAVKYAHNTQGGSYAGLDPLDTNLEITRTKAIFQWKQMYQPIVISNIELAKNGGSDAEVADLMEVEMEEAKESLTDKFCTRLFLDGTGNDSKDIDGLVALVDDGTNVDEYGGITRTTYTWWKANYTATVGSLYLSDIATMFDSCSNGQDQPSLIVTTKTVLSIYEALLQSQIRFESGAKLDGGMKGASFRGCPMIADEYCTSGYMYFLNMDKIKTKVLAHPQFPTDKRGFAVSDMREPTNQDGQVGFIFWYGNFYNEEPRKSGVLRGITA